MARLSLGSVRLQASCQLVSTVDEQGAVLAKRRIADGLAGRDRPARARRPARRGPRAGRGRIELDRGLLVGALLAAGCQVDGINPLAASRYRDRHVVSRAKSDRGDAEVLADLVRTDRHNHRQVAGDSRLAVVAKEFEREFQFVSPPRWLQKGLFGVLAPLGRTRGYRAIDPRYLELARRPPSD